MALLDALAAKLVSAGVATLATDLFLAQMPGDPDAAIGLFETQGFEPLQTYGSAVALAMRPRIRVVVRAPRNDYPAALTKINAVRAVLGAIRDETVSGVNFECVLDTTGPYPMRYDENERPMLVCDFVAWVNP